MAMMGLIIQTAMFMRHEYGHDVRTQELSAMINNTWQLLITENIYDSRDEYCVSYTINLYSI
jgi:hypothetical protein